METTRTFESVISPLDIPKSCEINILRQKHCFLIIGKADGDDVAQLFMDLTQKVTSYLSRAEEIQLQFTLEKISASGVKCLLNLFSELNRQNAHGKIINVIWYVSEFDSFSIDLGIDLEALFDFDFIIQFQDDESIFNKYINKSRSVEFRSSMG